MSITSTHALDVYRAVQRGEAIPPAPGRDDWRVIAELRDARRAARPAHRPGLLARLLRRRVA
ncbi:hypothetical protein DSC45_25330 [Streptomyces sp. YIM 130001]|uniref:hypothetical protein n=1 Tax=Streptomyces sp. YIM 130001 TaxID=2259644 RepID=UPI000E65B6CB|nr:hypothetical protein [Streptomyces sp. YIM 130001]RII12472.1 hypothetical protein DSC45_25330 [Streptomyces sp. YIM 130001]